MAIEIIDSYSTGIGVVTSYIVGGYSKPSEFKLNHPDYSKCGKIAFEVIREQQERGRISFKVSITITHHDQLKIVASILSFIKLATSLFYLRKEHQQINHHMLTRLKEWCSQVGLKTAPHFKVKNERRHTSCDIFNEKRKTWIVENSHEVEIIPPKHALDFKEESVLLQSSMDDFVTEVVAKAKRLHRAIRSRYPVNLTHTTHYTFRTTRVSIQKSDVELALERSRHER